MLTRGLYAISRHPVYLALVLAMGGLAGVLDTLWLLIDAALLWIALDRCVIPMEETKLHEVFGEAYEAYCGITRRWL